MPDDVTAVELSRWQVMRALRAERYSFPAMIPVLLTHGLLECQDDHRMRVRRDNGESVCVTCENTLLVYWRRGLARLAETYAAMDVSEVKGAWFEDHEFILATCRENTIAKRVVTTTHTVETVQFVDGKEVPSRTSNTTTREEWRVNTPLLRLIGDVRDKMARIGGMNVDRPVTGDKAPDIEIHFHERDGDTPNDSDGAPN